MAGNLKDYQYQFIRFKRVCEDQICNDTENDDV